MDCTKAVGKQNEKPRAWNRQTREQDAIYLGGFRVSPWIQGESPQNPKQIS